MTDQMGLLLVLQGQSKLPFAFINRGQQVMAAQTRDGDVMKALTFFFLEEDKLLTSVHTSGTWSRGTLQQKLRHFVGTSRRARAPSVQIAQGPASSYKEEHNGDLSMRRTKLSTLKYYVTIS